MTNPDLSKVPRELLERYFGALFGDDDCATLQNLRDAREAIRVALAPAPALRTRADVDAEIATVIRDYHRHITRPGWKEQPDWDSFSTGIKGDLNRLCAEPTREPDPAPAVSVPRQLTEALKDRVVQTLLDSLGGNGKICQLQWLDEVAAEVLAARRDERRAQEQGERNEKPANPDKYPSHRAQEQVEVWRRPLGTCEHCDLAAVCHLHAPSPPTELESDGDKEGCWQSKDLPRDEIPVAAAKLNAQYKKYYADVNRAFDRAEKAETELYRLRTALEHMTAGRDAQRDAADAHYDDLQKARAALVEIRARDTEHEKGHIDTSQYLISVRRILKGVGL